MDTRTTQTTGKEKRERERKRRGGYHRDSNRISLYLNPNRKSSTFSGVEWELVAPLRQNEERLKRDETDNQRRDYTKSKKKNNDKTKEIGRD